MRFLLFIFFSTSLFSQPIKIATYNVENLFDMKYQGSEYEEYIPG
ncbi:endonuclease, partial [Sulfurovum lithotrophicum]